MPQKSPQPPSPFGLGDIYLTVFRHKWKILIFSICGIVAGVTYFLLAKPNYVSRAEVLVRYVSDSATLNPADKENRVRSPDDRGVTILNSEMEILTSRDLAEQVVDLVGADKILAPLGGGTNRAFATAAVIEGIRSEVPPKTSVIAVTFEHPDPEVARLALKFLIDRYLERHMEIHRAVGAYDFLSSQTDKLRARLNQTEDEARRYRTNIGVFSVEESKKALSDEMAQIRSAISAAEVDLESRRAALLERQKWTPAAATNQTNVVNAGQPSPYQIGVYTGLIDRLQKLRIQEIELLGKFTETNPIVQGVQLQVAELEKRRVEMETASPQLAMSAPTANSSERKVDLLDENTQVASLNAKVSVLKAQWERVINRIAQIEGVEGNLKEIERRRELEEQQFRYFSASLERARIDQALDASKVSNISVVQAASVPALNKLPILKKAGGAAGIGIALGLILAFLLDFMGGPKVQRPADFSRHLLMPLLLTIPDKDKRPSRLTRFWRRAENSTDALQPTAWDGNHPLRGYFEALRDRILVLFAGDPRRPKIIGVTACSRDAGSSSIAAGLAATLSETGDGNVLLVDLNQEHGSAQQYFRGRPTCALNEAHEEAKRDHGLIQENLYLATLDQIHGERTMLIPSKKIAELMPKLRNADYDFIIFDMPPVSHTSITFRVAGMADAVLLVAESEKTHRSMMDEAHALLRESNSTVYGVLNKYRRHIPRFLHEELNGAR